MKFVVYRAFFYIILPTYNRSKLVIRAVESILSQEYTNYQLIIFNDGSNQDYTELENLISSKNNIEYIKSHNVGINKLKNTILNSIFEKNTNIDHAYFFVLDDDDYLTSNSLDIMANEIKKYKSIWYCFNCKSTSEKISNSRDYLTYKKISYSNYLNDYTGDKHIVIKLKSLKNIRFPEKHFKNGYEHIFYCQIHSKLQIIPKTVKIIEYQEDGLSLSDLYDKANTFTTLFKQIQSAPSQLILYKMFISHLLNPKNIIKIIISDEKYYKIKKKLGLKVKSDYK